jgi:hypothetical protein
MWQMIVACKLQSCPADLLEMYIGTNCYLSSFWPSTEQPMNKAQLLLPACMHAILRPYFHGLTGRLQCTILSCTDTPGADYMNKTDEK